MYVASGAGSIRFPTPRLRGRPRGAVLWCRANRVLDPDMARSRRSCLVAAAWLCCGGGALAQTLPLAAISGRVTDPAGAPLGDVRIAVTAPTLQGRREGTTTAAGDFLIPFLPPGDYEILFRRSGFRAARAERTLRAAETVRLDLRMELAGIEETMTVTAEPPTVIGRSAAVGATYPAQLIDRLPVDRGARGAALLAPGVAATGLGGNVMIAGAMSYENLWLVDGVGVKEIVFGQPRPFPIEDAIEETTTAVAGISAEYGRFTGGVVNVVTRSGGNELSGSFRATLQNEAWRSLTPYERESLAEDPREDAVVPTWEATLGGPVLRDRLWYFLAGRLQETTSAETTAYTDIPFRYRNRESRLEAKLTWAPATGQDLRIAYGEIETREENRGEGTVMDLASLGTLRTPEDLLSAHYTATVGRNLFLEAQYSSRRRTPTGRGSRATDLIGGTVLRDGARGGASWNSPRLCAVCGVPAGELRQEQEAGRGYVAKASGLLSGPRAGAHELVVGVDVADELRKSNSFQSGSGFTVTASGARFVNGAIHPVFRPGGTTVIEWQPIFELSEGSRFRTVSAFVNDQWRVGARWSFNLGLRWDADDSRDQSGVKVSASDAWSPRLAVAFDPRGDGVWTLDAGFARYVASLVFSIGDIGTSAGRPARYAYTYAGPAVNAGDEAGLVSTEEALAGLFGWFFASGGTSLPLRQAPSIPGLNRRVDGDLVLPRSDETTLGVTRRLGDRGFFRLAGVQREFSEQYSERVDTTTGRVTDPASGQTFDLRLVGNGGRVERVYRALLLQADVRIRPELRVAGSYTLSENRGNFDGDDAMPNLGGATPEMDLYFFPEYGEARWRAPSGPLKSDQRHRARLWASWDLPLGGRRGRLSVAALERVDSGMAWGAVGQIDSRPWVTNPGYAGPPARVPYYFEGRGRRRTATATATDLSLHYAVTPPGFRRGEIFLRLVVVNLFDQSAQTRSGSATVLTAANDGRYAPFDPFVDEPVRGVHWDLGAGFGEALSADDFAPPRTLSLALGVRF